MVAAIVLAAQLGLLLCALLLGVVVPTTLRLVGWLVELGAWLIAVVWWLAHHSARLVILTVDALLRRARQRWSVTDDRYQHED